MRGVIAAFVVAMVSCVSYGACATEPFPGGPLSLDEIDARIREVREEIMIYQNRATYADRQAQQLMSHDFFGYRRALEERELNRQIVDSLNKKLEAL